MAVIKYKDGNEWVEVSGGGGLLLPNEYIKNASVSGNTLTLTKKDDTEVVFAPSGGGSVPDTYIKDVEINSYFGSLTFTKNNNTTITYDFNPNWYDRYWMMTTETANSDLYNAKEMMICWKDTSGYTHMNYLIFPNGGSDRAFWSLGEYWSNQEIYLDSANNVYISFDGTTLYTQNMNEVIYIFYRVV